MSDLVIPGIGSPPPAPLAGARTFQELQDAVVEGFPDMDLNLHEIQRALNDGQADLAARLKVLGGNQSHITVPITGANEIALPLDFVAVRQLRIDPGGNDVEFVDYDVFWGSVDSAVAISPPIAIVQNSIIYLYPAPAAGSTYLLQYWRLPTKMVNPADTPEIPHHLHPRLVYYAQAQIWYRLGSTAHGDRYMAMFSEGAGGPDVGAGRKWPGPMTMRLEPGPFDLDPDATHI